MRISDWSSDVCSSDLPYQRHAVGEEQHALYPVGAHQQIDQRDRDAGLAGAGGHGPPAGAATLRQRPGPRPEGAPPVTALAESGLALNAAGAPLPAAALGWKRVR